MSEGESGEIAVISRHMTARVAGRLHTEEVAQSSIDLSKQAQRAKEESLFLPFPEIVLKSCKNPTKIQLKLLKTCQVALSQKS